MNHRSVTILLILCLMGLLSIGAMFGFHHYNAKNAPPKRHYPIFTPAEETEPEPEVPAPTPRKLAEVEARLAAPEETPEDTSTQETEEPESYQFYPEEPTTPSQPDTPQEPDNENQAPTTEQEPQTEPQSTTGPETPSDQGTGEPTQEPQPGPGQEPAPTPDPTNKDPNSGSSEPSP